MPTDVRGAVLQLMLEETTGTVTVECGSKPVLRRGSKRFSGYWDLKRNSLLPYFPKRIRRRLVDE